MCECQELHMFVVKLLIGRKKRKTFVKKNLRNARVLLRKQYFTFKLRLS